MKHFIRQEHLESIGFEFVKKYEHPGDDDDVYTIYRYRKGIIEAEVTYRNDYYDTFEFLVCDEILTCSFNELKQLDQILNR
jgi:hypothetical protein